MSNEDKMIMDMIQKLSENSVEKIEEFRKQCLKALEGKNIEFTNALCDVAVKRKKHLEVA